MISPPSGSVEVWASECVPPPLSPCVSHTRWRVGVAQLFTGDEGIGSLVWGLMSVYACSLCTCVTDRLYSVIFMVTRQRVRGWVRAVAVAVSRMRGRY